MYLTTSHQRYRWVSFLKKCGFSSHKGILYSEWVPVKSFMFVRNKSIIKMFQVHRFMAKIWVISLEYGDKYAQIKLCLQVKTVQSHSKQIC